MNVVDSSAWLEYFADTKNGKKFEKVIENTELLLVPSITLYEVFKKILMERDEHIALQIVAHMKMGKVIELDMEIALSAAKFSKEFRLPMADSIIFATGKKYHATIWTQDADFKNLEGVKYFRK
ncbi:MAG: type II toxin-antitoxin system VapC family toxin [Bacteroidota bacterium]